MLETLKSRFVGDQLKADLLNQIRSGKLIPGNLVLSERKLAENYRISYLSVRRAVDDLVRDGVLYRIPRKGTFVAHPPERRRRNFNGQVIGVISNDLHTQFAATYLDGIERRAAQDRFSMVVCNSRLDSTLESAHLQHLLESGVAGVILESGAPLLQKDLIRLYQTYGVPLVLIDKFCSAVESDYVGVNNFQTALRAVKYLASLGHKRIAHITSHTSHRQLTSIKERFDGYCQALSDCGLDLVPEYVQELKEISVHTEMARLNLHFLGYSAMRVLLELEKRPTAVLLLFDAIACGAYRAIAEAGLRVPQDISLIGIDNDAICDYLKVPLTTMAQPIREIGETAAGIVIDRLSHPEEVFQHRELPTTLIARESCGYIN